jgi:hypothetical protein
LKVTSKAQKKQRRNTAENEKGHAPRGTKEAQRRGNGNGVE